MFVRLPNKNSDARCVEYVDSEVAIQERALATKEHVGVGCAHNSLALVKMIVTESLYAHRKSDSTENAR